MTGIVIEEMKNTKKNNILIIIVFLLMQFNEDALPALAEYDYVKYYKKIK